MASFRGLHCAHKIFELIRIKRAEVPYDVGNQVREKIFLLVVWRRADIDGVGGPVLLATISVRLLEVFKVLAHPGLVAAAEIDERGIALPEILLVVRHEFIGGAFVDAGDNLEILFEEVLLYGTYKASIAVFADEIDLLQFGRAALGSYRRRVELFDDARLQVLDAHLQKLGPRRDPGLKFRDKSFLALVADVQSGRRQTGRHPEQTQKGRVRRAAFGGQFLLDADDRAGVIFGRRTVARADKVDRQRTAGEVGAHGSFGLFHLFERELLFRQHGVAALPQ